MMMKIEIVRPNMTLFRITPDKGVTNNTNKKFWRLMHELLSMDHSIKDRIERDGLTFRYRLRGNIWFDMVARAEEVEREGGAKETVRKVEFYMACPDYFASTIKSKMIDRYPQATVEIVDKSTIAVPDSAEIIEYKYKRHDIFSLNCNDTEQTTPISSLLNAAYDLQGGDFMRFSVCLERVDRKKWKGLADFGWSQVEKKRVPSRVRFEASKVAEGLADVAKFLAFEAKGILDDVLQAIRNSFFKNDSAPVPDKPKITFHSKEYDSLVSNGDLSLSRKKQYEPVFAASVRLAVDSEDKTRKHLMANSGTASLSELKGANSLEAHKVRVNIRSKHIEEMNTLQSVVGHDPDRNIMSCKEIGKLNQYPTRELQMKYADLLDVKTVTETDIAKELQGDGMYIGYATQKSEKVHVSQPTKRLDKVGVDILVQTRIGIGPPGSGKSTLGTKLIVEAVNNGFGGLYIDPAKGSVGDEIEKALPPAKVERYRLGQIKMALDFREVKHSPKAKNRLAKVILSLFSMESDDAKRTERFIKAAVFGMQTGRISEIIRIFTDGDYRSSCISKMPEGFIHRITLEQFGEESDAMQRRILDPILTRLDFILGDEDLAEWMDCEEGIDMVEIFQKKKAIIIDIPKRIFGKEGIELIANLLTLKMDLAMELRPDDKQDPFWIVLDEPHQYQKSQKIWENAVVEARKYRVSYVFLFHEWLQLDYKLRHIVKSANPHISIFAGTSKHIWNDFKEDVYPLDVDDVLRLPLHHAVNVIQTKIGPKTMILKMADTKDKRPADKPLDEAV
jgi:hypothetical protein